MRCNHKLHWHQRILDLILLGIVLSALVAIFIQTWFLLFQVDQEGLQSKRYLSGPLLEILSEKPIAEKHIANWITMVVMEDGVIEYPTDDINDYIEDLIKPAGQDSLMRFLSLMVETIPEDMSIVKFTYKGENGLCFYFNKNLPYFFRILQTPRNLIRMFIGIIVVMLFGIWMTFRLKKNLRELGKAIDRVKDHDLDTPLVVTHQNELSDILVAFDEMRLELKQHRSQGALIIMSITHDLKTPLTSLLGFLEAIKDGMYQNAEDILRVVDKMIVKTNLLQNRIDEMLDFSRTIIGNKRDNEEEYFPLKPLIDELKSYFLDEAKLHKRQFSIVEDDVSGFCIGGSSKKLTRSIINLYDNAFRYTRENDPIRFTVSLGHEKKILIINMDDGGSGVEPENRERIFDLFYRKDKGRNTRGMGIGLASVKYVAELHGGSVSCGESDLGGASFEVRLPVISENQQTV